jgi:hypothetical protein
MVVFGATISEKRCCFYDVENFLARHAGSAYTCGEGIKDVLDAEKRKKDKYLNLWRVR